jgi:hypothetical protein
LQNEAQSETNPIFGRTSPERENRSNRPSLSEPSKPKLNSFHFTFRLTPRACSLKFLNPNDFAFFEYFAVPDLCAFADWRSLRLNPWNSV